MPNPANRGDAESRLSEAIAGIHQQALAQIRERIGDKPDEIQFNDAFWIAIASLYREAIREPLRDAYLDAVVGMNAELGQTLNLDSEAAAWADGYSQTLAGQLVDTRRGFVSDAIRQYNDKGWTIDDFMAYLLFYFGVSNAAMIAVTEITNAISEAERQFATLLQLIVGTVLAGYIRTAQDDRVCPICAPLDGMLAAVAGYPPFHHSCRCEIIWS